MTALDGNHLDGQLDHIVVHNLIDGVLTTKADLNPGTGTVPLNQQGTGTPVANSFVDGLTGAWTGVQSVAHVYAQALPGSTFTVPKVAGAWPARPSARTDLIFRWRGADPSPPIVSSGTGGMLDGVDERYVLP